jgi:hypothetical protein
LQARRGAPAANSSRPGGKALARRLNIPIGIPVAEYWVGRRPQEYDFVKCLKLTAVASVLAMSAMGALALPVAANAATYVAQLEYKDTGSGVAGPLKPFGTVTVTELNADTIEVSVTLATVGSLFISNGGPHNPFVFDTKVSDTVTILSPVDSFKNGGRGSFDSTPFGDFTNDIACCGNHPGASHGDAPPLNFTVYDPHGITFAGIGATFSPAGQLLGFGTGSDDHFATSTGGYLFAADIYDKGTGLTYNVAAKYAEKIMTSVPEPQTWALMILGFGGMGAVLRNRRRSLALQA